MLHLFSLLSAYFALEVFVDPLYTPSSLVLESLCAVHPITKANYFDKLLNRPYFAIILLHFDYVFIKTNYVWVPRLELAIRYCPFGQRKRILHNTSKFLRCKCTALAIE